MKYSIYCNGKGDCDGIPCNSAARDSINEQICIKLCERKNAFIEKIKLILKKDK